MARVKYAGKTRAKSISRMAMNASPVAIAAKRFRMLRRNASEFSDNTMDMLEDAVLGGACGNTSANNSGDAMVNL